MTSNRRLNSKIVDDRGVKGKCLFVINIEMMIVIELDWEYSTNIRVAANELTNIRQRHIFV